MFPPIVMSAVSYAGVLALMSVAATMTYLTTKFPNFALGSFVVVGSYLTVTVAQFAGLPSPYLGLPLAVIVGGLLGLGVYKIVLKQAIIRGVSLKVLTALTLAIDLILFGLLNIYADYLQTSYGIPSRFFYLQNYDFVFAGLHGSFLVPIILVFSMTLGLYVLLTKTNFGIAMRATVENAELAGTMGINTEYVLSFSWFVSGGAAAIGGYILPFMFVVGPSSGGILLIAMFAGSVVGGLSSIYGAVIGGYFVGLAEIFVTDFAASVLGTWIISFEPAIPLLIMVATLLIAPQGLASINLRTLSRLKSARFRRLPKNGV